jgi:hypothetical protein
METLITVVLVVATLYGTFMTFRIESYTFFGWCIYKLPALTLMVGGALAVLYKFGFVLVVAI